MAAIDAVEGNSNLVIINKDYSSMQLDLLQNETNWSIKVMALTSPMTKLTIHQV